MSHIKPPVADWVSIPELHDNPFPIYQRLRAEGGVHWVPAVNRYLITSYEAVSATEHDQDTFSANEESSLQIRAMGHSMLRRDDPEHHIERRQWQPALSPKAIKRVWQQVFEKNAEHYLKKLLEKGPGADLIEDFCAPYAAENLREILGFYNVDQADLQRWSQTMIDATGNYAEDPDVWARGKQSFDEVDDALDEMLKWHARHPDNTLISSLLALPEGGMPIEKIRANMKMTIGGGLNEPRDALGVAAWALLTHPEQRTAVEADPSLWPTAFEETIRWVAPIGMYSRQTTCETELAGVTLPAGARLGICVLSANHDEDVWPDASAFDIHREVKPHLAFSKGVHVCMGNWIARAEVAQVALPLLFSRLPGLDVVADDAPSIAGWVFRGMRRLPVQWSNEPVSTTPIPHAASHQAADIAPRIAIVGSGPAGCFTGQALNRQLPNARLDMFEQRPVPYGLTRYGVAADHQGTKSVSQQFDALFQQGKINFHGNVAIGSDITLEQLKNHYDAVILATGLSRDRALRIPGSNLPGIHGAGHVTRLLNSHPGELPIETLGRSTAIIGLGNVAIDVARLLLSSRGELAESDINIRAHERLSENIQTLHIIGRSPVSNAKFDPVMIRELSQVAGLSHGFHGVAFDDMPEGKDARLDALRLLRRESTPAERTRVRVEWWFNSSPAAITGTHGVDGITIDNEDSQEHLDIESMITAIGFEVDPDAEIQPGRNTDGRIQEGLYVAGWLRHGPRGTIPDQRTDARSLARRIADDIQSRGVRTDTPDIHIPSHHIDFDGWRRIDLHETNTAAPQRVREKLLTRAAMLETARNTDMPLPPVVTEPGADASGGVPMTLWFGTESGTAELVADDLERHLAGRAHIKCLDMADFDPSELDLSSPCLIICSTYGDGEVPSSIQGFYDALRNDGRDLGNLNYAIFGLGDRSYAHTYSRGSELLDEALRANGARRLGEYGRHDASGAVSATEAARDWAEGVLPVLLALERDQPWADAG